MNTHGMAAPFFIFCMQLYLQKQITILIVDQGEKNDQIICYSDNGIMVTKKFIKKVQPNRKKYVLYNTDDYIFEFSSNWGELEKNTINVNKEEKNRTTYKKYETGTEDTYGEGEGRVYESDEDPLDLYSPVEGKIEIKIR